MADWYSSGVRGPLDARPLLRHRHPDSDLATSPPLPPSTNRKQRALYRPGQPIGYFSAAGTPYQKKYLTKKCGFCLTILGPPIAIVSLVIMLVPVLWAIADHTLHVVQMNIAQANLTGLTNESFPLSLSGSSAKAGIFPATLYFRKPVDVYWMTPPPNMTELHLGQFHLGRVSVASGHGKVIQSTNFQITDQAGFGQFTQFMVSQPRFTWNLVCESVHAEAFGFMPTYKNYLFRKHVHFKGIHGFEDVSILDFQLPGNDPQGGITVQTLTSITNPSPFSVQLGHLDLNLFYKGMYVGPVSTSGPVNITTGVNTVLLVGRMISQAGNQTNLDYLSEIFTNYLNGEVVPIVAKGISTTQANGQSITWLTEGIKALSINVPLQSPSGPIGPIKSIEIDVFNVMYHQAHPWTPTAASNNLKAAIGLPFGFALDIVATQNEINLMNNGSVVGVVHGGYSNSTLNLSVLNAGSTAGTLHLTLPPSPLEINETQHDDWLAFEKQLVYGDTTTSRLFGNALAVTDTPAGRVVLNPIKFDVLSGLRGLQGLSAWPTTISGLDVTGGTSDALQLAVNTTIINPSNLNLSTGDVTFNLVNDQVIGTVTMHDLNLQLGQNNVTATSDFTPKISKTGMDTLNSYISGGPTVLHIDGTSNTSSIPSLQPAMEALRLNATLPPLGKLLIPESWLSVPTAIDTDPTVYIRINLSNPFTAPMNITGINSSPVFQNLTVGTIDTQLNPAIHGPGKTSIESQNIPMRMDTNPKTLVSLLLQVSELSHTSLGPWPHFLYQILAMPPDQINTPVRAVPGGDESSCPANGAFDLQSAMLTALEALSVKIPAITNASIVDYDVTLNITQDPVPVHADNTSLYLLGPAGAPLIQKIVNDAILTFNQGNITHVTDAGFDVALAGQLQTDAPTNAVISFPSPIEIRWQGTFIATITLPPICTIPGQGVPDYRTAGHVNITDQDGFTQFATYILHNANFTWDISSDQVQVMALGITYSNVTLTKSVTFDAFNGLPGVLANNFDIPADTPNALNITTDSYIPSPATLGIEMNTARFNLFFQGTPIGNAAANGLTLAPTATTQTVLTGQLVEQTNQTSLDNVGVLFSQFLQGHNVSLQVQGDEVVTPYQQGPVNWLTTAFKTLTLDVTLEGKIYEIIYAIQLMDLELQITGAPDDVQWNVPVGSRLTQAQYANPFHFSLGPTQAAVGATVAYEGVNTAQLNLPMLPAQAEVSTGPETRSPLDLSFDNQRLQALDHDHFSAFLAQATDTSGVDFQLSGTANVSASTHIGQILITGIPLNVSSHLPGINSFGHQTSLSDVYVNGSTTNYISIPLKPNLRNPSNITLHTRDLYLPVFYNNVDVGRAYVPTLDLLPGNDNNPQSEFRYWPQDPSDSVAQDLVSRYLGLANNGSGGTTEPLTSALVVGGTPDENEYPESPYSSLLPALQGVTMNANLIGLGARLVKELDLVIPALSALFDSKGQATLWVHNPLQTGMTVNHIISNVWKNGEETGPIRATVDVPVDPPVRIAPGETTQVPAEFVMTGGVLGSLDLLTIPLSIGASLRATIDGGYVVPSLPYTEYDIYSTYDVTVLGASINVTDVRSFLEDILGALTPTQVTNDLGPVLQQLPSDTVAQMSQSLNLDNPVTQFACSSVPVLQGLPACAGSGGGGVGGLLGGLFRRQEGDAPEDPLDAPEDPFDAPEDPLDALPAGWDDGFTPPTADTPSQDLNNRTWVPGDPSLHPADPLPLHHPHS